MPEKPDIRQTEALGGTGRAEPEVSARPKLRQRTAAGGSSRRPRILHGPALRRLRDLLGDYSEQTGAFF